MERVEQEDSQRLNRERACTLIGNDGYCPVSEVPITKWPVILSEAYFSGVEAGAPWPRLHFGLMLRTSETPH